MNGIRADQYGQFEKDWRLVTVRYRKDSGELRFVYANDAAWATLRSGKANYPNGSVFAKIAVVTQDDPVFPSSAVPSGSRRVQYMLKDRQKYGETGGWGYALFDAKGDTYPGDLGTASVACYACHKIVADKDYVFSQIMGLSIASTVPLVNWQKLNEFVTKKKGSLPKYILNHVPSDAESVRVLEGGLSKNLFYGTLDEIRPLLAAETKKANAPSLLYSKGDRLFSLVFLDQAVKCGENQLGFTSVHSTPSKANSVMEQSYCLER